MNILTNVNRAGPTQPTQSPHARHNPHHHAIDNRPRTSESRSASSLITSGRCRFRQMMMVALRMSTESSCVSSSSRELWMGRVGRGSVGQVSRWGTARARGQCTHYTHACVHTYAQVLRLDVLGGRAAHGLLRSWLGSSRGDAGVRKAVLVGVHRPKGSASLDWGAACRGGACAGIRAKRPQTPQRRHE